MKIATSDPRSNAQQFPRIGMAVELKGPVSGRFILYRSKSAYGVNCDRCLYEQILQLLKR